VTDLYLPPVPDEIQQGDIYEHMPSTILEGRPLRVARPWRESGGRELWGVHREGGPAPQGGFKWRMDEGGEGALLVRAHLGLAMVMSHDCEIDNDPVARTLAMIRPATELSEASQEALFSGRDDAIQYAIFALEVQTGSPITERSFVDFRRLTTVRPAFLQTSTRVASLTEELRAAVAESFILYLFRGFEASPADRS
jgi:hypothetical protein